MRSQRRWVYSAALAVVAGLLWLKFGWAAPWPVAVLATLPGVMLIASGSALLLWPGDTHITHHLALGSAVGMILALLLSPWFGFTDALALLVGAAVSFLVAGRAALLQTPLPAGVPMPAARVATWRKAACDEALLGFFITFARIPLGEAVTRDVREIEALCSVTQVREPTFAAAEWHRAPGPPENVKIVPARALGSGFEWMSFDSGFVPDARLPGAERWRAHAPNNRMAARVFRHPGAPRPWLICIHGYRMGIDSLDLSLFAVKRLHHTLGVNLLMPILPLHGGRRIARITGGHFFDGPLVDLMHAEAQALWDLRRCLAWIHATQPQASAGVLGYSLGGYNAALLAAFEPSLACVIAGIPVTDIPAAIWQHMPMLHRRYIEAQGVDVAHLSALLAPVSPLHMPCAVAPERRYIIAATGDQLVPPRQPLQLWEHWGRPSIHWYEGSHLSVRREPGGRAFLEKALQQSGLTSAVARA